MSEMTSEKELNVSTEKNTDKISESDQQSELKRMMEDYIAAANHELVL